MNMPNESLPAESENTQEDLIDPDLFITYEDEPEAIWDIIELEKLLKWAVKNKMSDMIISTGEPIWLSRLGLKIPITQRKVTFVEVNELIDKTAEGNSIASSLMGGSEKNYAYGFREEKRNTASQSYRFRANATSSTLRTGWGSVLTLRHIPNIPPSLTDLGVEEKLCDALQPNDGFILVAGKTGTGKTTLVGAILRGILEGYGKSIVTYEEPVEFIFKDLPNRGCLIDHHEIGRNLQEWVNATPNANRRDPDIVFLGEAKEKATMAGLLDLGSIGKCCYATLHTSRVFSIVPRVLDRFDHEERVQMSTTLIMNLRVLISQRLLLHKDQKQRVAIREFLIFKTKHRDALMEVPIEKIPPLIAKFVEEDGQSFLMAAKIRYDDGLISRQTYESICNEME